MSQNVNALSGTEDLCWKCLGTGYLTWTTNANGVCFACKGTGRHVNSGRVHAFTFAGAGAGAGIVWQFLPVAENGYPVPNPQPNDDRVARVLFQAIAVCAERPRASTTPLRANVAPDVGREAMRLAKSGASVDDVARAVGIDENTRPATWFSRNRRGVDVM